MLNTFFYLMEYNKVHNINFLDNNLPDKCANLIIADPPYYKVKGGFDFIWNSFEDYNGNEIDRYLKLIPDEFK